MKSKHEAKCQGFKKRRERKELLKNPRNGALNNKWFDVVSNGDKIVQRALQSSMNKCGEKANKGVTNSICNANYLKSQGKWLTSISINAFKIFIIYFP